MIQPFTSARNPNNVTVDSPTHVADQTVFTSKADFEPDEPRPTQILKVVVFQMIQAQTTLNNFDGPKQLAFGQQINEHDLDPNVQTTTLIEPLPSDGPSSAAQGTTQFRLADQPQVGDRYKSETPHDGPLGMRSRNQ